MTTDTITFDNALMPEICGPHHQHLALIETQLGLKILTRGNVVTLEGPEEARIKAKDVLEALRTRLEKNLDVDTSEVSSALRLLNDAPTPKRATALPVWVYGKQKTVTPRSAAQTTYMQALETKELVFGVGPAGTGKTYLAVAHAAYQYKQGMVKRIVLSRPALEAGERIGFLPGDMKEKVDPYLRPLYDALYDVLGKDYTDARIEKGDIEIAPIAFMRGRTFTDAIVVLDEAQNATIAQMKMFLTRLGEGSRMVVTGDPSQTDLPDASLSGLGDALHLLNGIKGTAIARFSAADVVRHRLVKEIVQAYDGRERARMQAAQDRTRT